MIDLLDPALHASGAIDDALRELRASAPVAWCEGRRGSGYWSVTGHPELVAAARDPATFSSYWGTRPEVLRAPGAPRRLHSLDPPEHGSARALAARTFFAQPFDPSPIVHDVVARFARGGGDAMTDLAEPVAARVLGTWLGVDPVLLVERVGAVHAAGAALVDTAPSDPARADRASAARAAEAALAALVGPAHPDHAGVALLLAESLPTLVDAIGGAAVDLVRDDDLAPTELLVDELLRRASPNAQFARLATRDTTLGGRAIRAGDQVVLWFCAANRDPRVFADPEALVPARSPNPHVAFGAGPHRCLGAHLARQVVLAFARAFTAHRFVADGPFARRASSYLRGYARIPLRVLGSRTPSSTSSPRTP